MMSVGISLDKGMYKNEGRLASRAKPSTGIDFLPQTIYGVSEMTL